jgi:peroxiredoxin-like protein
MEAHYYTVNVTWKMNRLGELSSSELTDKIEVATPPPFAKGVEKIWSPEHLFTASVNSCYMTTFLAIAENSKLEFTAFECSAKGKLEQVEGKYAITEITLSPLLKLVSDKDKERAERILQKSEAACLISNSIKSKVSLQTTIR